ncbi:MAG: VWA domain-containing protein [Verrucomicrobiota bacterium]
MSPFDPSKFTAPTAKPLPVILLLDCSGSMCGDKIRNLNDAVRDMLEVFRDTENRETEIHVAIITFGAEIKLHQALASAGDIQWHDLSASGGTPLGTALKMAKAMIEDRDVLPSRAYRPTVVLVSDGRPGDSWESPLQAFMSEGRSSKCDRMAMAIGADADEAVLGKFLEGTKNLLFYAENAKQLRNFFKFVTMSITIRTKSQTPNVLPEPGAIDVKPATIEARSEKPKAATQDPSAVIEKNEQPSEEGYW